MAEEHIAYRKHGDHATNMPSTIRFGNAVPTAPSHVISSAAEKSSDRAVANDSDNLVIPTGIQITVSSKAEKTVFVRQDTLKYIYDACNNISEVWENGQLSAKYSYDKLNRIVREDNKRLGKTTLFTYDNNGNILGKREFAFTLKETEKLEELTSTDMLYAYNGDKLLFVNDEQCKYDSIGNPLVYRNKICMWNRGRNLVNYNGVEFAYNGQGERTSKSANGATTNYNFKLFYA